MFDANYYMEKLRKGEYVLIEDFDGGRMALYRGVVRYNVITYDGRGNIVAAKAPKREILGIINRALTEDLEITTWVFHSIGRYKNA